MCMIGDNYLMFIFTLFWLATYNTLQCYDLTYGTDFSDLPKNHFQFDLLSKEVLEESRRKRDASAVLFQHDALDDSGEDGFKLVNETEAAANFSHVQIDYRYYELNLYKPELNKFADYWIDIPTLLQNSSKTVKGELKHKQLANSYRRAVSQKLSFKFPFYGHETENVTIATGGFVYAGDQVHSWLAATQYIAPLMANFDTTSSEDSNILYADTGEAFIVEWNQVVLRHQAETGNFTFQVSLHKNGDIMFVYKHIPVEVKRVSDLHHPRKVGLSDAYLFTHTILTLSRRVIYEYHRVEVDLNFVKSGAVIVLKAQPVCVMFKDCRTCMSSSLPSFNCTWCDTGSGNSPSQVVSFSSPPSSSSSSVASFCSDKDGLNRRRQDYLDFQCHREFDHVYCNDDETPQHVPDEDSVLPDHTQQQQQPQSSQEKTTETSAILSTPATKTTQSTTTYSRPFSITGFTGRISNVTSGFNAKIAVRDKSLGKKDSDEHNGANHVGVAVILLFLVMITSGVSWLIYAYTNPHTPSGQFLIRNRPALWKWPSNHANVRYTASSVHM